MGKKIYLICPAANASDYDKRVLDRYVRRLESSGNEVHYPPRDVDQNDPTGMRIMTEHRRAMYWCDEVCAVWKPDSTGSVGDLGMYWGMAYMLSKQFRLANKRIIEEWLEKNPGKSHTRWAYEIDKLYRDKQ
jgi:hypothetical protein